MRNIALFNIDSYASSLAIQDILIKHKDEIKVLVLSKPIAAKKKSFWRECFQHWQQSGLPYVNYLAANFLLHPHLCRLAESHGAWKKQKPRIRHLETLCQELGIRCIRTAQVNGPEVAQVLRDENIDLISIFYFDQILRQPLLSIPKNGVINFHAAMLPHCRGLHPIVWSAIQNQPFGISAHTVPDARIDAGPVLAQQEIRSYGEDHILSLEQYVNQAGVSLYTEVMENLPQLKEQSQAQGQGSYFSDPKRDDLLRLKRQGFTLLNMKKWLRSYLELTNATAQQPSQRKLQTT